MKLVERTAGAGDSIAESLEQMGYTVKRLTCDDLTEQQLGPDRQDLATHLGRDPFAVRGVALPVTPAVTDAGATTTS